MNAYVASVIDYVKTTHGNEPEFVQTVEEVILPLLAPLHFLDRARHACLNHLRLRRVDQAEGNLLQDISKRRLIIHAGQFVFFNIRF